MMKAKIRILNDWQRKGQEALGEALRPGVIIDSAKIYSLGSALYPHPATGFPWMSYLGEYEILEVLD